MKNIFSAADILLPDFINESSKAGKWGVVACDQYTSEPEYWDKVYGFVGDAPSALHMILPEVFLAEDCSNRLKNISEHMREYQTSILKNYPNSLILVKRTVSNGKVRVGLIGKVDLEEYDYCVGSNSAIRATEGTVLERIPPRVAVRRNATVELPHIMLLINDLSKSIIESISCNTSCYEKLYDFNLLFGGHVEGYLLTKEAENKVMADLEALFSDSKIALAVGDGNHSLASAKARYEEVKAEIGSEKAKSHPLRYALCEVVNLHDESLEFEPIYRLVKTQNASKLLSHLKMYAEKCGDGDQFVECVYGTEKCVVSLGSGTHTLTVGTLQRFLDDYNSNVEAIEIDYIHGLDSINKLAMAENAVGFIFDGMKKEALFESVEKDGALPRKTFSMGEAQDKRFYIECRKISE